MNTLVDPALLAVFSDLLRNAEKVALVTHVNPDGDALGSSLALAYCLRLISPGLEVVLVTPNRYPEFLRWLDKNNEIMVFKDNRKGVKEAIATSDLVVCLDFNALSRLEDLGEFIQSTAIPRVLIDHHIEPKKEEFLLVISDVTLSSTAELVYRMVKSLMKEPIPLDAAEAIMTGVMTDTNMFRDNSSNPDTFMVIADLLRLGIDKNRVASYVYDNFSETRMRLLGYALSQKMMILPQVGSAYIAMSQKELSEYAFQPGDTEGFVNFPLGIKGVNVSAYISEQLDGSIRFSFRSRGDFSVNDFARRHFNGGGHKNAAGGHMNSTLDAAVSELITQLENYKDEILASL